MDSIIARLKLNRIGGNLFERWNMWFNAIIHVKPYHYLNLYKNKILVYYYIMYFRYCMAVVSSCCEM